MNSVLRCRLILLALFALIASAPSHVYGQTYEQFLKDASEARTQERFRDAEGFYRNALEIKPRDVDATRLLALMVAFQDKLDEALVIIDEAVSLAPDDVDVLLTRARILGWMSKYREAEQVVEAVVERAPSYGDAWALKGRLAYYQNDYVEARLAFERAAELTPDALEPLLGLGDVARALGQMDRAENLYDHAAQQYPNSADAKDRLRILREGEQANQWRVDLEGELSFLSRTQLSDWSEQALRLERIVSPSLRVFGRVEHFERFNLNDWMMHAGLSKQFQNGTSIYAEAGAGIRSRFQPDWQVAGGLATRVWREKGGLDDAFITLDSRVRHYAVGTISSIDVGWQQYFADGQVWVWAKFLNTMDADDQHLTGWSVSTLFSVSDRFRVRLATALAPESDRGIVTDTRTFAGGIEYDMTETMIFRLNASQDNRENSYRRFSVRSGLSIAF